MSPQMYLVECVLPKEPRARKALVRRWSSVLSRGHRRLARSGRVERVYGRPGYAPAQHCEVT